MYNICMKRFDFWIDEKVIEKVKILAKTMGINVSSFFRMAIIEKIKREEINEKRNNIQNKTKL